MLRSRADRGPFVAGLVLGAGGSARLGRPKQLLPYGDGTLLGHVVGVARECRFEQTIVAIGGHADEVRATVDLSGTEVVVNEDYGEGCSSSIAAALAVVDRRCELLVLMLGDQPGVTAKPSRRSARASATLALAACRYDDGRAPAGLRPRHLRRARRPARRQGRVAAARRARRRRRRRPGAGGGPARCRHPGGLPRGARGAGIGMSADDEIRHLVPDAENTSRRLAAVDYLVDEGLATSMYLSLRHPQPRCCSRARRASARPRRCRWRGCSTRR